MKKYNGPKEKPRKSWALELRSDGDHVLLYAVDVDTGEAVAHLACFHASGRVTMSHGADGELKRAGYNPHEHFNSFDRYGRLAVES